MGEGNEEKRPLKDPFEGFRTLCLTFPWVLALVLAFVFQAQFILLRNEMATVKIELSTLRNSTLGGRSLSKRSLEENDKARRGSGIEASHFRGTFPFQKVEKDGKIGPWSLSSPENAIVALRAKDTELEITTKGLYYVYAQVYYLTSQPPNSYQLLTYNGKEEREDHRVLSTCASQGRNTMGEASCYTGVTGVFDKGHRLYLHQIEQSRIINNSNGCSFIGVILLKKTNSKKKT